jgi:hypothetical protein
MISDNCDRSIKTSHSYLIWSAVMALLANIPNVNAAPACSIETGSCYEQVQDPGIPWTDAKTAAEALSYNGVHGHLATITSQAENDFITNNLRESTFGGYWIGGFQPPGSPEPAGNWQWVTGEPFVYTNWRPGEPNNVTGSEDNLVIDLPAPNEFAGFWNDEGFLFNISGYVVEYDKTAGVPFAAFEASADLKFGPTSNDDSFAVSGRFALGADSDGIDPVGENVSLKVGSFSTTIPPGSFVHRGHGRFDGLFSFKGTIDSVPLQVVIQAIGNNDYLFEGKATAAKLDGTLVPMPVSLVIGNDNGQVEIATGMAQFSGLLNKPH